MVPARIVIVEDQVALLKTLVKSLSVYPELEIVATCVEGEEAVTRILEVRPHLVLLDLELPGFDGIEVTRRVKAQASDIEILILTSFDDEQKVYQAVQAGASGYLVKRVGPERIRTAIQEVLEGGTVIESRIARRFWNHFQSVQTAGRMDVPRENPWGLTEQEFEVLRFVARGLSNAEVGQVMSIERRTVRTHLAHIYRKMGVHSHVEAVVCAVRAGWIEL